MSIALSPSEITLPAVNQGWSSIGEFVCQQFPRISKEVWLDRFASGKVHWHDGSSVTFDQPFLPSRRLCYYREVATEPQIPFVETVVYQDEHILVACKPHFLPVTPGGEFVNECLLERLRRRFELPELVAVHRLDRETAGLVLFSKQASSRAAYYELFASGHIEKRYLAVAAIPTELDIAIGQQWQVENRLVKANPAFVMQVVAGDSNASSSIQCLAIQQGLGLFQLQPHTGKTHQLRVHMQSLGLPLLYDKYYPILQPKQAMDFSQPLQLLAQQLRFVDPITGQAHHFCSKRQLQSWGTYCY